MDQSDQVEIIKIIIFGNYWNFITTVPKNFRGYFYDTGGGTRPAHFLDIRNII
jgi:hypothetical protein